MTDAAGCEPHRPSSRHWRRRLVQVLQQQYYVSPEVYSLPVYQEFASLRPPLGGRTRLVVDKIIDTFNKLYLFVYLLTCRGNERRGSGQQRRVSGSAHRVVNGWWILASAFLSAVVARSNI